MPRPTLSAHTANSISIRHYYIPHTRTRGYLIAVPRSTGGGAVDAWADKVKALSRPCSSPLEAFLLPTDDPRIQRAREDLATLKETKDGVKRTTVDWIRCESRHAQAREQEFLGLGRPLTAWQDNGGPPTMPDGAWNDWATAQTERVLDLMDISVLRLAKNGTDVSESSHGLLLLPSSLPTPLILKATSRPSGTSVRTSIAPPRVSSSASAP